MSENLVPDSDEFKCDLCGAQFDTVSDLQDHKRAHRHAHAERGDDDRAGSEDIGAAGLPTAP